MSYRFCWLLTSGIRTEHPDTAWILKICNVYSIIFPEIIRTFSQYFVQFKIFSVSSWFPKLMHSPSSSVCLQTKVTIHQQKFVLIIIRRVHHVTVTSPTISRLRKGNSFVVRRLDRHFELKVTTCLAISNSWFRASSMIILNKKPTRSTLVLKS
jgi:hypothetical protein